jgi:PmbA protein
MNESGNLKKIKEILDRTEGVDAYRITGCATVSYELFFVHRRLETVRSTDTAATDVTVYVDHDGKLGDSTFHVYQSMSSEEIAAKTAAAVSRAKLVFNEPYELAPAGELDAALPTNLDEYEPEELGRMIADAVFAADVVPGGSINALEIFIYRDTRHVVNSRGVNKSQTVHRVMIEAIPTFTDERQSVELYEDYRFTRFDAAKLTAEIAGKLKEASDRVRAVKPEHGFTTNIVLRPMEIEELVFELADDCNYRTIYDNANLHGEGDDLQPGSGDKLTVTMKAVVEGSERSAFFDDDGTNLRDTVVIKDGVVCGRYGGCRFGQYLGEKEPSGNLGCIRLEPGTLTDAELEAEPYLECVSLSGIQLDLYNDYIGGEIRLAYLHEGGRTTPLTGITMSAKLSEVLAALRLHERTCVYDEYEGPVKLLLKGVDVL